MPAYLKSNELSRNYSKFGAFLRESVKIKAKRVIMNCNLEMG